MYDNKKSRSQSYLHYAYVAILVLISTLSYGQKSIYFQSNTTNVEAPINDKAYKTSDQSNLVSLGDNTDNAISRQSNILGIAKVINIIGDQDYKSNDYKISKSKNKSTCPDPIIDELDNHTVMISINSNWFVDEAYRYQSLNSNCEIYNEIHLIDEMENILDDYSAWTKIIVTHHGIADISERAGHGLGSKAYIPIYGQLYEGYRNHVGQEQDMASDGYRKYISFFEKLLQGQENIYFISGHEELNYVVNREGYTLININTGNKNIGSKNLNSESSYISKKPHIGKLYKDGLNWKIDLITHNGVQYEIPLKHKQNNNPPINISRDSTITVNAATAASKKYNGNKFTRFFMGEGYRKEWSEKINVPLLDIDNYDGGLEPYAIGGGLQTMSIKFKSKNGRRYAFRVLDKEPEKSLTEIGRESIYKNITQELITTMHPYGPLVANSLLNHTDIIHITPQLYILDNNNLLSGRYSKYIGKIGTLEEKPRSKKKKREGFAGSDEILSTYDLLIELRKSHKNKLDTKAYTRARVMDMFIGDWDRHEDNWKWAKFEEKNINIYRPIPKDRDHVFSKWTGIIPSIADIIISNAEDFDYTFGNLRQLNFKARYLDRELSGEITLKDWLKAADYIIENITDERIALAINEIPKEVRDYHGDEIKSKLISRKSDLKRAVGDYASELNKNVIIQGTNKKDYFTVERNTDGTIDVKIRHKKKNNKKGKAYFKRNINPKITKTLYIFALDGKDEIIIKGEVDKSIKIRIISGDDKDIIIDQSKVKGQSKLTQIYDAQLEDSLTVSSETVIKKTSQPVRFEPYTFDYNMLVPRASIRNSSGNGFGIGVGLKYYVRGFNKPDFAKKYDINLIYYPGIGAYRIEPRFTYRHFIGSHDFVASSEISSKWDRFPYYYGIGNDSKLIRDERNSLNKLDYDHTQIAFGLQKVFHKKSQWTNLITYELHDVSNDSAFGILDESINGFGDNYFIGVSSEINLDYTDNINYPQDGARLDIKLNGRKNLSSNYSGNIEGKFSLYRTIDVGPEITFLGASLYKRAIGNSTFYHLSTLGSKENFVGYTRNRFIDKNALLFTTEARVKLGKIKTPLIQFIVGIFGFYNSGKVWNEISDYNTSEWNNSYGGGFYIAPGTTDYSFSFTIANPEDDFIYTKIEFGFDF